MVVESDQTVELRALIVDDHANARKKLGALLRAYPWVEVVGEASSGVEAVETALSTRADVLFLDVQMPALNGFEALEQLHSRGYFPHVVFVTAHDEFAVKAFDVHAVDYLTKPVGRSRFDVAIQNDGKILVIESGGGIHRYNSDGTIDNSFNNTWSSSYGSSRDIAIQSDGKIIALGMIDYSTVDFFDRQDFILIFIIIIIFLT